MRGNFREAACMSQIEFNSTKTLLYWLLVYTLTRGILITVLQIGHIIMYLIRPTELTFW